MAYNTRNEILRLSGSISGSTTSGSWPCQGKSVITGAIKVVSGSVLTGEFWVRQSLDGGLNWDVNEGANLAGGMHKDQFDVYGDAVKIDIVGCDNGAVIRTLWSLI